MTDIKEKVARSLFDTFVVNTSAVAVQNKNYGYRTIRTLLSVDMISAMLRGGYSLGTYQQQSGNDMLKWICFDFDTKIKDENEEHLYYLKDRYVIPFVEHLEYLGIKHVVEFSGRRGFHIWILFDQIVSKNLAYSIVYRLSSSFIDDIRNEEKYGIDLFPKTKSGKISNKFGLQVKIPLSKHQEVGTYSYFIEDIYSFSAERVYTLTEEFLNKQYKILLALETNAVENIINICDLTKIPGIKEHFEYHKQIIVAKDVVELSEIKEAFLTDTALTILWKHISEGNMDPFERMLLLGIFGHMSNGLGLLREMFKLQRNYNKTVTEEQIEKHRKHLFPITFKYLYQYYRLDECPDEKKNQYLDDYLINQLGIEVDRNVIAEQEKQIGFVQSIVAKELNYFSYNDEVLDFDIYMKLQRFSYYDYKKIEGYIANVEKGAEEIPQNIEIKKYIRKEKDKERILVSLGAKERIITTCLINKLIILAQRDYKSYSYHLNMDLYGDVFYPWISSWTRFKNEISQFFSVPIFEDMSCLKIDFKHFYDSVYLQSVLKTISEIDDIQDKQKFTNIYTYLVQFNERVMMQTNSTIQGVPQGPAYARVLAELTMDVIFDSFLMTFPQYKDLKCYRYVDDMYVFSFDNEKLMHFLADMSKYFENRTLFLNKKKTKLYGVIKKLKPVDKNELQEFKDFNYDIVQLKNGSWMSPFDKEQFDSQYLRFIYRRQEWDINDANVILCDRIDNGVKEKYLSQFYSAILESEIGRGSVFRKFYEYIFNQEKKSEIFWSEKHYLRIPFNSINLMSMVSCAVQNIHKVIRFVRQEDIDSINSMLEKDNNQAVIYLQELINYEMGDI